MPGGLKSALVLIIEIYIWALFAYILAGWIPEIRQKRWYRQAGRTLFEPLLKPFRELIPSVGGFDLSPIVLFVVLILLQTLIMGL